MSKYLIVITLKLALITTLSSQNIYSALHHDRKFDLRDSIIVEKVVTTGTFYNSNGKEKKKDVTFLNESHQILAETRFDSDGIKTTRYLKISFQLNYQR